MRATATLVFASIFALFSLVSCTALSGAGDLEVEQLPNPTPERDVSTTERKEHGSNEPIVVEESSSETSSSSTTSSDDAPSPSTPKRPLSCDGFQCSGATPYCCQRTQARGQCVGAGDPCDGVRLTCSGKDDCSTGEVCCAFGSENVARCAKASECAAQGHRVLCLEDADCPGSSTCGPPNGAYDHPVCVGG